MTKHVFSISRILKKQRKKFKSNNFLSQKRMQCQLYGHCYCYLCKFVNKVSFFCTSIIISTITYSHTSHKFQLCSKNLVSGALEIYYSHYKMLYFKPVVAWSDWSELLHEVGDELRTCLVACCERFLWLKLKGGYGHVSLLASASFIDYLIFKAMY